MWRCVWGKFNQEPRRPKRSLTTDTIFKSIYQITSTPNFIAFHVFFYNNHFWTICVIWSKNGPLLFNLYHDPPERCLCFLLDLGFWHFFYPASKPRFMIYDVGYMICASAGSDVTVGSWKFLNSRHLSNFRCGRTEVDHLLGWGGGQF